MIYDRPLPQAVLTTDNGFREYLLQQYKDINSLYRRCAASSTVMLYNATVFQNAIYLDVDDRRIVYETYRSIDRGNHIQLVEGDFSQLVYANEDGFLDFFLGSAGSHNYGHWLTDDLPRATALLKLRKLGITKPIRIWMPSYDEAMDNIRTASLTNILDNKIDFDIRTFDRQHAIRFDNLLFTTPCSYHPVLKNPFSIDLVSNGVDYGINSETFDKIFILRRPGRWRSLVNMDEVQRFLAGRGFHCIDVETLSFERQAYVFSQAKIIVGCMGAAMANTIFAKPGTITIYLAPKGWAEPYYWDLAAIRRHQYFVCFGETTGDAADIHTSLYKIELSMISAALEIVLA